MNTLSRDTDSWEIKFATVRYWEMLQYFIRDILPPVHFNNLSGFLGNFTVLVHWIQCCTAGTTQHKRYPNLTPKFNNPLAENFRPMGSQNAPKCARGNLVKNYRLFKDLVNQLQNSPPRRDPKLRLWGVRDCYFDSSGTSPCGEIFWFAGLWRFRRWLMKLWY